MARSLPLPPGRYRSSPCRVGQVEGGVEASFDWRAAYDETAGTMLRARLLNDVVSYA